MHLQIFKFNSIYAPIFESKKRYIDVVGGRGRGGSYFVTDYFLFMITKPDYFRGCFMRYVLSDVRTSLFLDFKDRLEEKEDDFAKFMQESIEVNLHLVKVDDLPNDITAQQIDVLGDLVVE